MDKAKALHNLARAYFVAKVDFELFLKSSDCNDVVIQYRVSQTIYDTMLSAYLDCNIVSWDDISKSTYTKMQITFKE